MPPLRVFTSRETGVKTMAWSAVQDSEGVMHFGCDSLISFDGDRWRAETMDPTYAVRGLDVGPNGRIWAAAVNQLGWFETGDKGRLSYHSLLPYLPAGIGDLGDVWRVYAEGYDQALFVSRERVLRWNGKAFTSWAYPGMRLLWSTRTSKGIYIHYPPEGLLRMGPDGPSVVVPASALGPSDIRWLDDSGTDWLLLASDGFSSLHGGVRTPLSSDASVYVRANTPTSAVRLGNGSLAVGTLLGGVALIDPAGGIRRVIDRKSGLPANQIYSLYLDRDGALWAMGPSHIVRIAVSSGVSLYGPQSGYPPGGCESVASLGNNIYVASHSDVLRLAPDPDLPGAGRFTSVGITGTRLYGLLAMPAGLAVGQTHGLGIWTPKGMVHLLPESDIVFRVSASRRRPGQFLASQSDRILSVDPSSGRSAVVAEGLPDYGDTLLDDDSGRIWIGTPSRGLFVAGPRAAITPNPQLPRFGGPRGSGPAFVGLAGSTIVALEQGSAFFLRQGMDRFAPIAGVPPGMPSAISNADSAGGIWAAMEPVAGGHAPQLGRITVTAAGATWTSRPLDGLSEIGSLLALHVVPGTGGDDLWVAGSESLMRASPEALAAPPTLRKPVLRAWVLGEHGLPDRPLAGVLPFGTNRLHLEFSSLDFRIRQSERFQTMLGGAEAEWSPLTDSSDREIAGLREGRYDFRVRPCFGLGWNRARRRPPL